MPPCPAVTIHSHRTLGATPLPLLEETYLLMQRARMSAEPGKQERFTNLSGNCFLRVDSDARLSWSIDFFTLDFLGLSNYFPGRNLADRGLAFANGASIPFQFADDGIFIYDTVTADDPHGELRAGNVKIDYDLHSGLDLATYPVIEDAVTYADIVALASVLDYPEVSNAMKNAVLLDVFNSGSNVTGDFTATPYDGDPAGAGATIDTAAILDLWTDLSDGLSIAHSVIRNQDEILWGTSVSERFCTHVRLKRGATTLADIARATITGGAVAAAGDAYTKTAHGLTTGTRVTLVSLTAGLGLTAGTSYFFHRLTANTGYLCSSYANAVAGTPVNVTTDASAVVLRPALTVPIGATLRAPALTLGCQLTWPFDSGGPADIGTDDNLPSRYWLRYLCGGEREDFIPTDTIDISFYESSSGPSVDSLTVDATSDNFTVSGNTVTPATITQTGVTAVAATDIFSATAHGLESGDRVWLTAGTGFTGVTLGANYWAIRIDADTFQLAATYAESLTDATVIQVMSGVTAAAFGDLFTKVAHGLTSGQRVKRTGGSGFGGITIGPDYYVIWDTVDTFWLAESYAEAIAGTPKADVTSDGTSGEFDVYTVSGPPVPVDVTVDGSSGTIVHARADFIGETTAEDSLSIYYAVMRPSGITVTAMGGDYAYPVAEGDVTSLIGEPVLDLT